MLFSLFLLCVLSLHDSFPYVSYYGNSRGADSFFAWKLRWTIDLGIGSASLLDRTKLEMRSSVALLIGLF